MKRLKLSEQEEDEVDIFVTPPQIPHRDSRHLLEGRVEASVCSQFQVGRAEGFFLFLLISLQTLINTSSLCVLHAVYSRAEITLKV